MALIVNTNIPAMNSLNHLNRTNNNLTGALGRISSGLRITQASDDAAGLAVAENLDSSYRSLQQAARNINDGIGIISTAEGAANEVSIILKRMRELAVQSSSETLADPERVYVQDEYLQLASEIDRIADVTEFNGVYLARGDYVDLEVQAGIFDAPSSRIAIPLGDLRSTALGVDIASVSLLTSADAQNSLGAIETALEAVNSVRSVFGASQNRLESSLRNIDTYSLNLKSAESQIRDADLAKETADMTKFQIMQQAGVAILAQANQISQQAVRLLQG